VSIDQLVQHYGYWMVAGGILFEGNATIVSAAFLAHSGHLSLWWVCVIALATTTIENVVIYHVARVRGAALLAGTDKKALRLQRVLEFVRLRGAWILFASRFLVGWKSAVAVACGIAEMPQPTFQWANLGGAVVWTGFMAAVGYSGGKLMPSLISDVKQHEWTVAIVLALAVFAAVMLRGHLGDWQDRLRLLRRHLS
jgi:membrane protein DedA with SNARE-associated domain